MLSAEIISFIEKYNINRALRIDKNAAGYIYKAESWKEGDEISLSCIGNQIYTYNYDKPILPYKEESDELIVSEITIDNNYSKTKKESPIKLPFSLSLGDHKEIIFEKLKKKPYDKATNSYGHAWWFKFDSYRILTALDKEHSLIWLRVSQLTRQEVEKEKLKKDLRRQNKNITAENINALMIFMDKIPTSKWKERMLQGDEIFTEDGIAKFEQLLEDFVNQLIKMIHKKNATTIYNSVKKVVNKINAANHNYEIIDTLEREELCEFINQVVRKAGLDIDSKIDLTEDWRDW